MSHNINVINFDSIILMNPSNLKVTMDAETSIPSMEYHSDMDNYPDIPSLSLRYDSDSEDDDISVDEDSEDSSDDESDFNLLTQPPLVVPNNDKDTAHKKKKLPTGY